MLGTNSPPTHASAGHQSTVSTSTGCNQWLSLAELGLKVAPYGRNHSLVACTSICGCATRCFKPRKESPLEPCVHLYHNEHTNTTKE